MTSFNFPCVLRDATESTGNYTFERGSCGEQPVFSRQRPCSRDVKTINPDLTTPYLSSPFSQVNLRTDTFLAPRTGHEQPYWYRPSYFGWQYVTSATHITHQSSYLQLKHAPSVDFQLEGYHAANYQAAECHNTASQSTRCHATEYQCNGFDCQTTGCQRYQVCDYQTECQATECHTKGYERHVTKYHSSEYKATECRKPGYQDMVCHATRYQRDNGHATKFPASDSEGEKAQRLGGLAYDHGEFPKIISVHSMSESQLNMQENNGVLSSSNAIRSDLAKTELNMSGSIANQAPVRGMSVCSENSTTVNSEYKKHLGSETCGNAVENHENSTSGSLCNVRTESESKIVRDSTTENTSNHPFMSTILSSKSDNVSQSSPSQDACNTILTAFSRAGDCNLQNRQLSATATNKCESSDAESLKIPCSTSIPSNVIHGSPESEIKTTASTEHAEKNSLTQNREQLVMLKKKSMIQNRIQRINNIQKRLINEDKSQRTHLLKKIATLEKEIEHLSNGSIADAAENFIREGSPRNSAPVKMSSLLPNKELAREARTFDAGFSDQTSKVCKPLVEINVNESMINSISSEQSDGKLSNDGFRMNLFEKMDLLYGKSRTSPGESELTSSTADELQKSQTSNASATIESVSEGISKGIGEWNPSLFSLVYSGDTQQSKDRQVFVKSSGDFSNKFTEDKLKFEHSSSNKVNALYPELPDSWSSAFISESQIGSKVKASREELKRKQVVMDEFNDEPFKRRCKTLPRKIVRKDVLETNIDVKSCLGDPPVSERESKECGYNQKSVSPETGRSEERVETLVDCSDVNLSIKPGRELITPRVFEDDMLQRNMELRESKISDLLRKQKGLLQSLEKRLPNMMKMHSAQ